LIGVLYAMVALHFSLNGFYDSAYVAAAVLGLRASRKGDRTSSLFLLSVAGFLHFRALFYVPVAIRDLCGLGPRKARRALRPRQWVSLTAALVLACSSAWTFLVTWKFLPDTAAVNLAMEEHFGWGGALVVGAATLGAATYLFRTGERLAGLNVGWAVALTLGLPASRAWHSLALYPLLLLASTKGRKREVLLLWTLTVSSIAFRYLPNPRWLARGLRLLVGQDAASCSCTERLPSRPRGG
jgi:hypothetical protein